MQKNKLLAERLAQILAMLSTGERVDIHQLAAQFGVSVRTIQRDINERFEFLEFKEKGARFYQLNLARMGLLNESDVRRFANFASIAELFPKLDREFFHRQLTESVQVKGFEYENIKDRLVEFEELNKAIEARQFIHFNYTKIGKDSGRFYRLAPYALLNKKGIWYLVGTENDVQKTFCFTQISMLRVLQETFEPNAQFISEIKNNDSIYYGNQLAEVVIKVGKKVAPYFLRRNLLPNQQLVHQFEDGGILLSCKNVNEMDVVPIVQYWIPHLTIINPIELQLKMVEKIRGYLADYQ